VAERLTSYETWQAVADGWERWQGRTEEFLGPVRDWLVRAIGPGPGDTVLELSAGPGETGFRIAETLGPRGHLVSTDFAPRMVDVARRRAAALGLRNVEHRVMDAQRLDLETGSVDGVVCRFGYMLVDDPAAALAETRRVLRPGGRLALAVWGPVERNPWASVRVRFLVSRGHMPPPAPGEPGAFAMADAIATRTILEDAGFADVRTEEVPVRLAFADLADYERYTVEVTGAGVIIRGLPEREREALRAEIATAFARYAEAGGYAIPGLALCAEARG
jgi:SAM-dependent methyltransferase